MNVKLEHARFLGSMFIYVLASQATMVVDASVGGNLLGPDAVSAVDLVMPVYELFYLIVMMLGMGACAAASLALGRGDVEAVRRHFTGSILSTLSVIILLGAVIYAFNAPLVKFLCGSSGLAVPTKKYLCAMVPFFIVASVQIVCMVFTAMAGRPVLVMCCALVQFAVNLSCNLLFIACAGRGIEALAYSSFVSSVVSLLILLPPYLRNDCPFRMTRCTVPQLLGAIGSNAKYGSSFLVVNVSYVVMTCTMNALVLRFLGEEALFFWSVAMMLYLTCDSASTAANETSISLGGRYVGAGDGNGAETVYDRSLFFTIAWTAVILTGVFTFPSAVLPLFGAADGTKYPELFSFLITAIPFIACTDITCNYLIRLVPQGAIKTYCTLFSSLLIAVPVFFCLFHLLLPGRETYSFLALLPLQAAVYLIGRRRALTKVA